MLKYLSAVGLSVLLSVSSVLGFTSWHQSQVNQAFVAASAATYTLEVGYTADSIRGSCSGVLIKDHVLLTAAHCQYDYMKVNGKQATLLKVDKAVDMMLLKVDAVCPCVPVAQGRLRKGQTIYTYGYPYGAILGFTQVLTSGTVQGILIHSSEVVEMDGFMVSTLAVAPGNSGGGIYAFEDGQLKVVSVVSRGAAHLSVSPTIYMLQEFTKAPW